jgi:predicted phage-related endonuclease
MSNISVVSRDILEQMYAMRVVQLHQAKKDLHLADEMYLDMEKRLNEIEQANQAFEHRHNIDITIISKLRGE